MIKTKQSMILVDKNINHTLVIHTIKNETKNIEVSKRKILSAQFWVHNFEDVLEQGNIQVEKDYYFPNDVIFKNIHIL